MPGIRVATFNLESLGDDSGGAAPLPDRLAILRPQLSALEADVVCLQEVDAQQLLGKRSLIALDTLLAGTRYADYHRATTCSAHGNYPADRHNLVILSRFPIEKSEQVRHDFVPPLQYRAVTALPVPGAIIDAHFDRSVLYAAVRLPGNFRLHVLNLHLKAPLAAPIPGQKASALAWQSVAGWAEGYLLASMKRASQALEARLLVERILDAEPEAMIAVCGDFNADSWEVPVQIVRGEGANNKSLESRALTAVELKVPQGRRYSVLHDGRRLMLDHILVSPRLAALTRDVNLPNQHLADEVRSHPEERQPAESFHAPLCAEFDFSR